jgi:hypothetical protein
MQKEPVFLIKVGPKKGLGSKEPVFLIKVGPKKGLGSQLLRLNELWCGITATPATPPKQLSLAM